MLSFSWLAWIGLARLAGLPFEWQEAVPGLPEEPGIGVVPQILYPLVLVCGLLILLLGWWSRRQYVALPELPGLAQPTAEDHAVIIPARDEAAGIAAAVRSFPDSLVCVIDDDSADRTVELAAAAGAHVLEAAALTPGWTGKNNACWTGAQSTQSKWILFADGDTRSDPRLIHSLLEYARANSLQAVSVLPRPVDGALLARLLVSCASGLYFAGLNGMRINTAQSRQSLQNDQCLLFLRSGYDFIGGHRRVCGSLSADLAFGGLLHMHRLNCRTVRGETLASARRPDSLAGVWSGLQRFGCRFLAVAPAVRMRLVLACFLQAAWLPLVLVLLYGRHFLSAALFYAVVALAWVPWYGATPLVLLAPPAVYVVLLGATLGLVRHFFGLSIGWKGRRV
jgi:chlorobactene glucosyltransferase